MDDGEFLDSVEGEAAFFQSVARARPAGVHRFMNIVSVRQNINEISGRWVTIEQISRKLRQYYIMDNVEQIRRREGAPDDPDFPSPPLPRAPGEREATPASSESSQPVEIIETIEDEEKIWTHPHFRLTFSLPEAEFYEMMEERAKRGRNDPPTPESDVRGLPDVDEEIKIEKPLSSTTRRSRSQSQSQAPSMSVDLIRASGLAAADGSESSDLTDPEDDRKGNTDDRESTYSATRRSVASLEGDLGPDEVTIGPSSSSLARKKRELTSDSVVSRTGTRKSIGTASSSKAKAPAQSKKKRKR